VCDVRQFDGNVEGVDPKHFFPHSNFMLLTVLPIKVMELFIFFLQVMIKQASGLPLSLSNFVFCQYSFWNHPDSIAVPPLVDLEYPVSSSSGRDSMTFKFYHHHHFDIPVTEEFLEHCSGKLSSLNITTICATSQASRSVCPSVSFISGML
jgi:hypothetical protein